MITIIAQFNVKEDMTEQFIKSAIDLTRASRKERGCLSYRVLHERANHSRFTFIEEWLNDAATEQHNNSAHFKLFLKNTENMLNEEIKITQLEKIPSVFF